MYKNKLFLSIFLIAIGLAVLAPTLRFNGGASLQSAESASRLKTTIAPTKVIAPVKTDASVQASTSLKQTVKKPTVSTAKAKTSVNAKVLAASTVVSTPVVSAPVQISTVENTPTQNNVSCGNSSFNEEFLCLINQHRQKNGKGPLSYDSQLSEVARAYSASMNQTGVFSHVGADGSKFYERCAAMETSCFGENLAKGFTSASNVFELWKNSPGHNANMLGDYSVMGLGLSGIYATNLFR